MNIYLLKEITSGGGAANNAAKKVIFKNCAPFINCISKIINTQADNAEYIDIVMPVYNLSNFWRTFEMSLINCEVNLTLNWSENCVIVYTNVANQGATFQITETKLYVPVVIFSTQDNAKLLPQLKSGFKRTINWNKYQAKPELLRRNSNLSHLVKPCF